MYQNKSEGLYKHLLRGNDSSAEETFMYTQCEPNYTSKIFPCFGQLDIKAKFQLSLLRKKNMQAYSNNFIEKS